MATTTPDPKTEAAENQTPPELTPEQIEEQKKKDAKGADFFTDLSRGRTPKVETDEEKKAREKKEADDAPAAAAAAAAKEKKDGKEKTDEGKAAPAKVAPAKKVIRRAAGYEDLPSEPVTKLAAAADRLSAAAERVEKAAAAPAAPKPAEPSDSFTPAQKRELAILATLPEVFADKPEYKGIDKRAEKYIAELPAFEEKFDKDFAAKWERQNADKTFDSEEARDEAFSDARAIAYEKEHGKFKGKFNIEPDPDDYDKALVKLETKPLEEALSKTQQQLAEREAREHAQLVERAAVEKGASAMIDLSEQAVKIIGENIKDIFKADGTVDMDKIADVEDGDIIAEALTEAAERAKNFASDVVLFLATPDERRKGEAYVSNPVYQFALAQERHLASLPPEKTKDADGKTFARGSDFAKMTKEQREKHWVLDGDTIIALANDTVFIPHAQATIEAEKKRTLQRIERRGLKLGDKAAPAKQAAPAKTATETQQAKPNSPASTDPAPAPANGTPGKKDVLTGIFTGKW